MTCARCGRPLASDARFCIACGAPTDGTAGPVDPSDAPRELDVLARISDVTSIADAMTADTRPRSGPDAAGSDSGAEIRAEWRRRRQMLWLAPLAMPIVATLTIILMYVTVLLNKRFVVGMTGDVLIMVVSTFAVGLVAFSFLVGVPLAFLMRCPACHEVVRGKPRRSGGGAGTTANDRRVKFCPYCGVRLEL